MKLDRKDTVKVTSLDQPSKNTRIKIHKTESNEAPFLAQIKPGQNHSKPTKANRILNRKTKANPHSATEKKGEGREARNLPRRSHSVASGTNWRSAPKTNAEREDKKHIYSRIKPKWVVEIRPSSARFWDAGSGIESRKTDLDLGSGRRVVEVVRDGGHGAYEGQDGEPEGQQSISSVPKRMHLLLPFAAELSGLGPTAK